MKELNKIQINPQKLIHNDELLNLRGGDTGCYPEDPGQIPCFCYGYFAGCQVSVQACLDRCEMSY